MFPLAQEGDESNFNPSTLAVREWYWHWLRDALKLTLGGRFAFTFVAFVLGGLGAAAVIANAVTGGAHGDREGGAPLVVLGIAIGGMLLLVIAVDAAFRSARRGIRHLRSPSQ
jgi:hypothetical protein